MTCAPRVVRGATTRYNPHRSNYFKTWPMISFNFAASAFTVQVYKTAKLLYFFIYVVTGSRRSWVSVLDRLGIALPESVAAALLSWPPQVA